jgi:hypothetical protein
VVNENDLLPVGKYWLKNDPARPNASSDWKGQIAIPWTPEEEATYADANGDGVIDANEVLVIGLNWHKSHSVTLSSQSAPAKALSIFNSSIDHSRYLKAYRAMYKLLANSPDTEGNIQLKEVLKKLIEIGEQQLPTETNLLQNYPNPFNPETWIPFSISERTHVVIKIYSITGQLIRILDLGVKEPGKYVSRDRAASWDGRNNDGDEVASSVYFYRLHAGDYVSTKKMVVLK